MRGILLLAILMIALVACTAPPEEIQQAEIVESTETEEEVQEVEEVSEENEEVESLEETEEVEEVETTEEALESFPIDTEASSFEFEGYGPGKSHTGTFTTMSGSLTYEGESLVAAEGVIDAASVNTGIGGLDSHLMKSDFFDVENHPEIMIKSTSIEYTSETEVEVTGDLTFLGVTNELSFPATVSANGISAEIRFDTTPWGMENTAVNKEVRVAFDLVR